MDGFRNICLCETLSPAVLCLQACFSRLRHHEILAGDPEVIMMAMITATNEVDIEAAQDNNVAALSLAPFCPIPSFPAP